MTSGAEGPEFINVEVGGRVYARDLGAEVHFETDSEGLNQALAENPGKFAFWASLEIRAKSNVEQLENRRAVYFAQLYSHYEAALARTDTDGKRAKPTVDTIKSAIQMFSGYQKMLELVRQANESLGLLMVARQAMVQRKDSLLAVASNYRAELDAHIHDQLKQVRDKIHLARGGR